MVGAAGIIGSAVNSSRQRRESRNSDGGGTSESLARRPTIGEILASRHVLAARGSGGVYAKERDRSGGGGSGSRGLNLASPTTGEPLPTTPLEETPISLKEQVKFYISLFFGILASLCVFALLFLIPLVVEPSISTLLADFDPVPATCVTIGYDNVTGISKCGAYSSCREGCTNTPSQCHQIHVSYRRADKRGFAPIKNFTILNPKEYYDVSKWDVDYTQLLINLKGCGYPPRVQCEEFGRTYSKMGLAFPCFYSRANPRLVVTDYNWEETAYPLIFSLGVPVGLFGISISVLSTWYCPSCEERGKNKRPCRSQYKIPKSMSQTDRAESRNLMKRKDSTGRGAPALPAPPPERVQSPVVQQPRRKPSAYRPNSPSLETISSGDTTVSSVNSLNDGWQSPPTPPPRVNFRMNSSQSARARKL